MMGWVRQSGDRKAHVVTDTRPIYRNAGSALVQGDRARIGTTFVSACPWDIRHLFEDPNDYEWMPWLWQPTPDEACWTCWRKIARLGGFEYPV